MARLLLPDDIRSVYTLANGTWRSAAGLIAVVYAAESGSQLADIATYQPGNPNTPGPTINGSVLTVDEFSEVPSFWLPDGVDTVWISVNGGPRHKCTVPLAANDARLNSTGHTVVTVSQSAGADFVTSSYATPDLAVQAALNAVAATGGTVLVKAGTYNFAAGVTAAAKTRIVGEGPATILRWATNANPASGAYLLTVGGFSEITALQIDGNKGTNPSGGGIRVTQGSRVWLNNLYVASTGGDGIHVDGISGSTAHANKFTDLYVLNCGGYGIYCAGGYTYDQEMVNVWVGSCNVGIRLESGDCFLTGCHVWGNTGNGAELAAYTKVANSYFETNGGYGVNIGTSSGGCHLAGVQLWKNGTGGLNLDVGSDRATVVGCVVRDNVGPGITVASSFNTITGCTFFDVQVPKTQTVPVSLIGSADSNIITNCVGRSADHLSGSFTSTSTGIANSWRNNVGVNPEGVVSLGNLNGVATVTFDRRSGSYFAATMTGNWTTVSFPTTSMLRGFRMTVVITQDATGGWTVTWPANVKVAGGSLVVAAGAGSTSVIEFVFNGTNWLEVSRALGVA